MNGDSFEWDEDKAVTNWQRHGVSFEQARKVFRDPFAVEWIDDREDYGEVRFNRLGMCDGVILYVSYTDRGERTRIISARRAVKHEREN